MLDINEARSLENKLFSIINNAEDVMEQILEHEIWTTLGYNSFSEWWTDRVLPRMKGLSMKPTRELSAKVVEQVRKEEKHLPKAQRRTQRELGELAGVSEKTLQRRNQDRSEGTMSPTTDLVDSSTEPQDQIPFKGRGDISENKLRNDPKKGIIVTIHEEMKVSTNLKATLFYAKESIRAIRNLTVRTDEMKNEIEKQVNKIMKLVTELDVVASSKDLNEELADLMKGE